MRFSCQPSSPSTQSLPLAIWRNGERGDEFFGGENGVASSVKPEKKAEAFSFLIRPWLRRSRN